MYPDGKLLCIPRLEKGIVTGPVRLDHILGLKARHGGCPSSCLGLANDMVGADVGSQHAHISLS